MNDGWIIEYASEHFSCFYFRYVAPLPEVRLFRSRQESASSDVNTGRDQHGRFNSTALIVQQLQNRSIFPPVNSAWCHVVICTCGSLRSRESCWEGSSVLPRGHLDMWLHTANNPTSDSFVRSVPSVRNGLRLQHIPWPSENAAEEDRTQWNRCLPDKGKK